jgi:2-amino-4-hydroxy-6-hydroxymethyldihydropteridine diphosphokinase
MTRVVFDLGTNIDREASLAGALEKLSEHFTLLRASSVYCSAPVGMANQPDYLNISLEVETDKGIEEIRAIARGVEDAMGRNRNVPKFGPRIIDIDILLHGDTIDAEANVPHAQTENQMFVVLPLAELYPDGKHPVTGTAWADLRRTLLAGRSPKDAGIHLHGPLDSLPLGPKARQGLLQKS